MSYRLQVRLADVAEAAQWYDQRQLGLGEKFVREVDQAIARVIENPLAFPVILRIRSEINPATGRPEALNDRWPVNARPTGHSAVPVGLDVKCSTHREHRA